MRRFPFHCFLSLALLWAVAVHLADGTAFARSTEETFFETRIRPVLVEHCYECHSAARSKSKGGLRVDSREALLAGGDTRPAVVAGHPEHSLLIEAVRYVNPDLQMPPKHRLSASEVADLVEWVTGGAPMPTIQAEPITKASESSLTTRHWSFEALRTGRPPPPRPLADAEDGNAIDGFVDAQLAAHQLHRKPAAPRRTLIRRLTYDLTGLPPTPQEVSQFIEDDSPDAYQRLVDRLLSSPHYGERWARWWLDVARYADSNGQDENKVMANAWRYRDWVVRAFAKDLPFNQFTMDQIAGDLLPTEGIAERELFDRWTATGFLVLGPKMLAEQDKQKMVMDLVDEQIDVVSRAFLGLTVGCARCHDHKFDPVSTRDYYALAGIFRSTRTMANLDFVSQFNERCISTSSQLAAIESHAKAEAELTNQVASVENAAKAEFAKECRRLLPQYLGTALGKIQSAPLLNPELLARLGKLVEPDPATNAVSRGVRRLQEALANGTLLPGKLESDGLLGHEPLLAPGRVGQGFVATGHNHLEIAHSTEIDPPELTVEAWVRTSQFSHTGDARRWLVGKNANEWTDGHYSLYLDGNHPGAYLNIGGGPENVFSVVSTSHKLSPDRWHHLAMSYDGHDLRLYFDGKVAGETRIGRLRTAGTQSLTLGCRQDGYVHFQGQLDEIRVFNRPLPPQDIQAHFEHPEIPARDGVVARWDFNSLTPEQQESSDLGAAYTALLGPGGVFDVPADSFAFYPEETRNRITLLNDRLKTLQATRPPPKEFALAVADDRPIDLPVHIRGSHLNLAPDPVPRGFVRVVEPERASPLPTSQSGRLELARWLTDARNPLTARVIVNRIWQAHFGEGLVRSSDNFGVRGDRPTHPELLDWLSGELIRGGWSIKAMHRLILMSATYRQACGESPGEDPENRLLSHFPRQRLEAEMVRDSLLAVSGRLDLAIGGSLVNWKDDDYAPEDRVSSVSTRRSVYLPVVRDRVYDVFTIFDFANPSVGSSKRTPTVVSHQALFFLNSPLVKASAASLSQAVLRSPYPEDSGRIRRIYEEVFNRPPTDPEIDQAQKFLVSVRAALHGERPNAEWSALCQTLFAANEFIYRD